MSIRTTVSLDDDVLERLKRESVARGLSFNETLNDLLRKALLEHSGSGRRRRLRVKPRHMGYRLGLPYDNAAALIEYAEGPGHP